MDASENLFVADRENCRIQKFDSLGNFIKAWTSKSFGAITAVYFDRRNNRLYVVDDLSYLKIKHRGSDLIVIDSLGRIETRIGRSGNYSGGTTWYHDLVVDDSGNVYIGDILGNRVQKFVMKKEK